MGEGNETVNKEFKSPACRMMSSLKEELEAAGADAPPEAKAEYEKFTDLLKKNKEAFEDHFNKKDMVKNTLPFTCNVSEAGKLKVYVPWSGSPDEISALILGLLENIHSKDVSFELLKTDYDNTGVAFEEDEKEFLLGMWCAVWKKHDKYRMSFTSKGSPGQLGYSCALIECLVKFCNCNKKTDIFKRTIPPEFLAGEGKTKKILHNYLSKIKSKCTSQAKGHLMVTLEKLLSIWSTEQMNVGAYAASQNKLNFKIIEKDALPQVEKTHKDPNNKKQKITTWEEDSYWNAAQGEFFTRTEKDIIKHANVIYRDSRDEIKELWNGMPAAKQYQLFGEVKRNISELYHLHRVYHAKLSALHNKRRSVALKLTEMTMSKKDKTTPGKFYLTVVPEFNKIDCRKHKSYCGIFNPFEVFAMTSDAKIVDKIAWKNNLGGSDETTKKVTALHSAYITWMNAWGVNLNGINHALRDDILTFNRYDSLAKVLDEAA